MNLKFVITITRPASQTAESLRGLASAAGSAAGKRSQFGINFLKLVHPVTKLFIKTGRIYWWEQELAESGTSNKKIYEEYWIAETGEKVQDLPRFIKCST